MCNGNFRATIPSGVYVLSLEGKIRQWDSPLYDDSGGPLKSRPVTVSEVIYVSIAHETESQRGHWKRKDTERRKTLLIRQTLFKWLFYIGQWWTAAAKGETMISMVLQKKSEEKPVSRKSTRDTRDALIQAGTGFATLLGNSQRSGNQTSSRPRKVSC